MPRAIAGGWRQKNVIVERCVREPGGKRKRCGLVVSLSRRDEGGMPMKEGTEYP